MGHKYLIGSIEGSDFDKWVKNMNESNKDSHGDGNGGGGLPIGMILVVILAIIAGYYFYTQGTEEGASKN